MLYVTIKDQAVTGHRSGGSTFTWPLLQFLNPAQRVRNRAA